MNFGLAEGDTDAENGTFPIRPDPDGDENGAVLELSAVANFFVSGVQDHVGTASQRALPPARQFNIKLGGAGADLGGADRMAAEFLDDFSDFAGRDTLNIHLGEGEQQGFFAAGTFFQSTGVKFDAVANLRNTEADGADTRGKDFGFKAIGAS